MPAAVIIGAQWGDEGKGKLTDLLAEYPNVVACGRFTGADNAGHTVVNKHGEFKLSLVPSSIFTGKPSLIGHGVLINPQRLWAENEDLNSRGVSTEKLSVSPHSYVIMPYHRLEDYCLEKSKGAASVGTTKKGVGPCVADKANRTGIQMWELLDRKILSKRLDFLIDLKQPLFDHVYQWDGSIDDLTLRDDIGKYFEGKNIDKDAILDDYLYLGQKIKPFIKDTRELVEKYLREGVVILEAAQGALLDPDLGTIPYVTSTNPTIGGLLIGSGIPPKEIEYVLGVMKAYITRVGGGPFPTEMDDETGRYIRDRGKEYGTRTGRPRRCGWFDLLLANLAKHENGIDGVALTKIDVLEGLNPIKYCVSYDGIGKPKNRIYSAASYEFEGVMPVYDEVTDGDIKEYISRLEQLAGPIDFISHGPERNETICKPSASLEHLLNG